MIQVKRLTESAKMLNRGSPEAAGYDVHADEDVTLWPMERKMVSTGISMAIPEGKVALIWPRSKLASKHGIQVLAGVVDSDYRGEVKVVLLNSNERPVDFKVGDAIAQILIQEVTQEDTVEVSGLSDTVRGSAGIDDDDLRL